MEIPFLKKFAFPKFHLPSFLSRPAGAVGIDIGTYSTKVVELKYKEGRAHLAAYGEFPSVEYLKSGGHSSGLLRYPDNELADLIRTSLKDAGVTSDTAVFSLPASASFVMMITLPSMSRKETEQALPYEARKYIPIPITEVVLDWEIFEKQGEEKEINALLVAVPRELTEKLSRVAGLAGIKATALEVETFSEVRSLIDEDPLPTIIINIGHQSSTVAIADEKTLRYSGHFAHGSLELTRALEGGLGISKERAEAMKRELGFSEKAEEREIVSVMTPIMEILFLEIERSLSLYNRRSRRKVQKVILTGAGAQMKGIIDYASTHLQMEVRKGNPFAKISTPPALEPAIREIGPSFSVAVGLALRDFVSS